jgi:hypothetical protein
MLRAARLTPNKLIPTGDLTPTRPATVFWLALFRKGNYTIEAEPKDSPSRVHRTAACSMALLDDRKKGGLQK